MSSYVALNARVRAQCLGNVAAILETPVSEAALMARASCQVRERSLLSVAAREAVGASASTLDDADVARLEAAMTAIGHVVPSTVSYAARRTTVIETAARVYEVATQEYIVSAVLESVREPDVAFSAPRVRRGEDIVSIDVRRGDSALLVRVTRDGHVERDWLVGEGEDCHALDDALDQALRRRGLEFDVIVEDHHADRPTDARLFGPALARDAADPARGAVLDAERPLQRTAADPLRTPRQTVRRKA